MTKCFGSLGVKNPRVLHEILRKPSYGNLDVQHGLDRETQDKPQTLSIGIDVPVRLGLTLVKRIQFHLSQITGVPGVSQEAPTLGLLILPSVPSLSPIIRRTARISILPIEPNLVERARISAINLDDYQLDHVTPPPSPSSSFSMAAYQRMITDGVVCNDRASNAQEEARQKRKEALEEVV
ncbi:hypothetical protein Tco_0789498 [Tanacetum coccineum]